jgi:hypothetical protein
VRRGGTAPVRTLSSSADGAWLAYLEGCAATKAQSLPPDTVSCDLYVVPSAGAADPARVARAVTSLPGAIAVSPTGAEWAALAEYDYATATGTLVRWRPGVGAKVLAPNVSFHGYGPGGELGYIAGGALFVAPPGGEPAEVKGVSAASSFELAAPGSGMIGLVRRKGSAGGELLGLARSKDGALLGAPKVLAAPVGDYGFGEGRYALVRLARDGGELLVGDARHAAAAPVPIGQRVRAFGFQPRGDALAFVADAAPGRQGDLHVVTAGGQVAALGKEVGEFRWAAKAPRLAWLEAYDPRVRSGTMGVGGPGRESRALGTRVSDFEISPDGRFVAYLQHSTRAGYSVDLVLAGADGGAPRAVAQGTYGFAFSPDGRWLYYRDGCIRNGEGCDVERVELERPGAKPEKLAEGAKSFEFDPRDPGRLLIAWKRMDRDALDLAVWSQGKLVTVDTYVRPGSARFLAPDSRQVAYAVVQEKREGVYVAQVP